MTAAMLYAIFWIVSEQLAWEVDPFDHGVVLLLTLVCLCVDLLKLEYARARR